MIILVLLGLISDSTGQTGVGQPNETSATVTLAPTLDAVGAKQRHVIDSIFIVFCGNVHGTAFLLNSGLMVTNSHVINGCTAEEILARSARGKDVHFSALVEDQSRDLALIKPSSKLEGGLSLGGDQEVILGKNVTTWGYPIIYTSGAPLLTVGYVAGFNLIGGASPVKHVVVNGAFNPGNSGGPGVYGERRPGRGSGRVEKSAHV